MLVVLLRRQLQRPAKCSASAATTTEVSVTVRVLPPDASTLEPTVVLAGSGVAGFFRGGRARRNVDGLRQAIVKHRGRGVLGDGPEQRCAIARDFARPEARDAAERCEIAGPGSCKFG